MFLNFGLYALSARQTEDGMPWICMVEFPGHRAAHRKLGCEARSAIAKSFIMKTMKGEHVINEELNSVRAWQVAITCNKVRKFVNDL